eukprot:s5673_g5.t1
MAGPWIQNSHAQMSQHQLDKVFFDGGLMNLQECTSLMTSTASETGTDSMGAPHLVELAVELVSCCRSSSERLPQKVGRDSRTTHEFTDGQDQRADVPHPQERNRSATRMAFRSNHTRHAIARDNLDPSVHGEKWPLQRPIRQAIAKPPGAGCIGMGRCSTISAAFSGTILGLSLWPTSHFSLGIRIASSTNSEKAFTLKRAG